MTWNKETLNGKVTNLFLTNVGASNPKIFVTGTLSKFDVKVAGEKQDIMSGGQTILRVSTTIASTVDLTCMGSLQLVESIITGGVFKQNTPTGKVVVNPETGSTPIVTRSSSSSDVVASAYYYNGDSATDGVYKLAEDNVDRIFDDTKISFADAGLSVASLSTGQSGVIILGDTVDTMSFGGDAFSDLWRLQASVQATTPSGSRFIKIITIPRFDITPSAMLSMTGAGEVQEGTLSGMALYSPADKASVFVRSINVPASS